MTSKTTDTVANIADKLSHWHTALSAAKGFIFGGKTDGDANPSKEGLQAHHKGKGPVDESNYLEALALAGNELLEDGSETRDRINELEHKIAKIIGSYPESKRVDIILYIGLSEKATQKKDSGQYDKKDIPTETIVRNERGINILKSWMHKTPPQIRTIINSTVSGDDYMKSRLSEVDEKLKEFNDGTEKFFKENTPKTCHPLLLSIPIINLFFMKSGRK